jgi:hypothetical protein
MAQEIVQLVLHRNLLGQAKEGRAANHDDSPAYRPATEKALETGLFLWTRFAGESLFHTIDEAVRALGEP